MARKRLKTVVISGPTVIVDNKEIVSCKTEFQCNLSTNKELTDSLRFTALKLNHQIADSIQKGLYQSEPSVMDEDIVTEE